MTIPAIEPASNQPGDNTQNPLANPPYLDGFGLIAKALRREDLTPGAFRVYVAIVLLTGPDGWATLNPVAREAAMTPHRARQFIGELVRVGLVHREPAIDRKDDGRPYVSRRYAPITFSVAVAE